MTTSQREALNVANNHAEVITQIMKFCEVNNIKFAHHEPLKYAVIKMHGMIDVAKALGVNVASFRWAYAVVPEVTKYFEKPRQDNAAQYQNNQGGQRQKQYSAKPV